ncbi:MAG: hypothetical protein NTV30_11165, partial [Chloroflexi bacterium]|nr:hypothetical protein [Chloroflexota bacterium]
FLVLPIGAMAFAFGAISLYRIGKYHKLKGTGMAIVGLVGGGIIVAIYLIILLFLLMLSLHLYVT